MIPERHRCVSLHGLLPLTWGDIDSMMPPFAHPGDVSFDSGLVIGV